MRCWIRIGANVCVDDNVLTANLDDDDATDDTERFVRSFFIKKCFLK